MPQVSISPVFNGAQFFDNLGQPLNGGKLFQYEAGSSSVQQTTYADSSGNVPNSNPIVLNSSGRIPTDLWLENGLAYNLVLTQSDGTTVLEGVDNVIGVVASTPGGGATTAIWSISTQVPTYVSPTQFLLTGNQTVEYAVNNRVQAQLAAGIFVYGTVSAVATAGGNTQVTLVMDNLPLTGVLSQVAWSVNVSTARTVDAGAVAYNSPATYTDQKTVGYQVKTLNTDVTTLMGEYAASQKVWTTTGTTNTYVATISPAITSYTDDQIFTLKFHDANTSTSTLNINNVGTATLTTIDSTGAAINPRITANQIGTVAYNGTGFTLITKNELPNQTGNSGTVLTTNGSVTSWASLGTAPTVVGTDGYTILPGKFMVQWGVTPPVSYPGVGGGTLAITFPTPFATCYGVQATRIGTENQSGNKRDDHAVTSVGPTGFTMFSNYENMTPQTFYWYAYGVAV
jgi:hypothetical protein